MRYSIRLRTAWVCAVIAAPLLGQTTQYSEPGSLGQRPVDRKLALREAVENARWRLGGLRLDPWLSLRELAWVEEATAEGDTARDLTATAGAGLHAYLPVGGRATVAAQALPEYVWWRERAELRRWAGRYALGAFVYGNRLSLELTARSEDTTGQIVPELERRVEMRDDRLDLRFDLALVGSLGLFARADDGRVRTGEHDRTPELARLDRDESWWVAGLAWHRGEDLWVGVGAGALRADFVRDADRRSHDGTTTYAELRWQRPKLQFEAEVAHEKRETRTGSGLPGFDGDVGQATVRWQPRERLGFALYGLRRLSWSLESERVGFLDARLGVAFDLRLGWRGSLRVFHESGTQEYVGDLAAARRDDVTSSGLGGQIRLGRGLALTAHLRRTRFENAELGLRRDFSEARFGLAFGGGPEGVF